MNEKIFLSVSRGCKQMERGCMKYVYIKHFLILILNCMNRSGFCNKLDTSDEKLGTFQTQTNLIIYLKFGLTRIIK